MSKFVVAAVLGLAFCFTGSVSAQDCCQPACPQVSCCQPTCCQPTCCRTPKKLAFTCVTKTKCRLKFACVTDECGCTRRKLVRVPVTVTRKRLTLVDRCPQPCGCEAAAPACGCGM